MSPWRIAMAAIEHIWNVADFWRAIIGLTQAGRLAQPLHRPGRPRTPGHELYRDA